MREQRTAYGWMLRLEQGEDIFESLRVFGERENIRAGFISGLGASGETELGFFVRETRSYVHRTFTGEHEIGALTGNFSELDGKPFPHCHVVLGTDDFGAFTGHLFRAIVSVTCEISIVTDPGILERERRPDLGYNPLAPRR